MKQFIATAGENGNSNVVIIPKYREKSRNRGFHWKLGDCPVPIDQPSEITEVNGPVSLGPIFFADRLAVYYQDEVERFSHAAVLPAEIRQEARCRKIKKTMALVLLTT